MTSTSNAAVNHPAAALIVGLIWLIAMIVFALFLAAMYTLYGIGWGIKWGYGRWATRYHGSHRTAA